jgi:hypothetical protein
VTTQRHVIAGRLSGTSGIATFCTCGLAFFALYDPDGKETSKSRAAARDVADQRWEQHWKQVRPDQWRIAHPGPEEVQ